MFVAGGNASISQGGVGSMLAIGEVRIERGGVGIAVAGEVEAGRGAIVGVAIAPKVEIEEGGRLIIGLREVVVGGVIAGAVFAVTHAVLRAARGR
jgi:hypothetical protein